MKNMLKKIPYIISVLSSIKMVTYQLVVLFVLSFVVPGTLIMFYFYRDIFVAYDSTRIILLIVSISTILVMASIGLFSEIEYRYSKYLEGDERKKFESAIMHVSLWVALLGCVVSLFVCYLCHSFSKVFFVVLYLSFVVVVYGIMKLMIWAESDDDDESEEDEDVKAIENPNGPIIK